MIAKLAAHFLMEMLISSVHYAELSHSYISSVTQSVHKWFHVPHLEVDLNESHPDY